MKRFVSYEEGSNGTFTENEMCKLYDDKVDKSEYPDYDCWVCDMLRSGVFEEEEK